MCLVSLFLVQRNRDRLNSIQTSTKMELTSNIFSDILSPLAIFIDDTESDRGSPDSRPGTDSDPLPIDCRPVSINGDKATKTSNWRLDGVDIDGLRFFAVPSFAIDTPPMRVDVYIPPLEEHSQHVRLALEPEVAMYATSKQSAINSSISQHLLQALDHWSSSVPDFRDTYLSLPFGSQIVVQELTPDPVDTADAIHLRPNYEVEQAMISLDTLQQMWPSGLSWPATVDTADLLFRSQIHEAITIVKIPHHPDREFVFKSLLRDQKYLYNELKMLLSLPAHDNLVRRPLYVVTHKCRFGGKRGVAGFVLEYYPLGSLAAYLPHSSSSSTPTPTPSLSDRFRWARQVTSSLIHVNLSGGFYPDLKPDNVVLRQEPGGKGQKIDAVLLDLEQRGGWFSWSPPEIAYVEYLELLASRAPDAATRDELTAVLRRHMPGWAPQTQDERYRDVVGGFSAPWLALADRRRRGGSGRGVGGGGDGGVEVEVEGGGATVEETTLLERAQTFMLGKLLWCIFEGRAVVRCGIDHELLRDPDPEWGGAGAFPRFDETPAQVRELIRACTAGAPEWKGRERGVVLRNGRLVPGAWDGRGAVPSAKETRDVARKWWATEVAAAKGFMSEAIDAKKGNGTVVGGVLGDAMKRPLLGEVLAELVRIEGTQFPLL